MRTSRWRSPLAVAATVLAMLLGMSGAGANAAVHAATVTPAYTVVHSGWFGLQLPDNTCLDSDAAGQAYRNPCQVPGNKFQDWNFNEYIDQYGDPYYMLIDQATGRCLDSNGSGDVYTTDASSCGPNDQYQDWAMPDRPNSTEVQDNATLRTLCGNYYTCGVDDHGVVTTGNGSPNYWNLIQ